MELFSNATFTQLNSKLPPALKSRGGEKSWAMQPRLETFEDLDEWPDSVAMAQHSIQAGPLDHSQSKSKQNSKEKRQGPKIFNVFNTTAVIAPESSTATSSRCLGRTWYSPHHLVFDTNKPGPDLFKNLVCILLRFLQYAYPVAEVEKILPQERVRPSDGPAFRFLWHNPDSKEPPDVYQMDFYPFGAASSPAVCSNALRQAVRDDGDRKL